MIEIHAHLLPGLDDGPETIEESLDLARAFLQQGVRHVVATPHVFPGRFDNSIAEIQQALKAFQLVMAEQGLPLALSMAGEVRLSEHVITLFEEQALPFLGEDAGYKTLLLEMPDGQIPVGTDKLISWLLARGVRPVIAHPERNRAVRDNPQLGLDLVQQGCALQLTAGALLGQFGAKVQQAAEFLIAENAVSAIASDAHNVTNRAPCMRHAHDWLSGRFNQALADQLTHHGPAALTAQGLPHHSAKHGN